MRSWNEAHPSGIQGTKFETYGSSEFWLLTSSASEMSKSMAVAVVFSETISFSVYRKGPDESFGVIPTTRCAVSGGPSGIVTLVFFVAAPT